MTEHTLIEIQEVVNFSINEPELLWGFNIDSPYNLYKTNKYEVLIAGWILGKKDRVVSIEVISNGNLIQVIPVNYPRPDVAQIYTEASHADTSGFVAQVGVTELPTEVELLIQSVFLDETRLLIGQVKFQKKLPFLEQAKADLERSQTRIQKIKRELEHPHDNYLKPYTGLTCKTSNDSILISNNTENLAPQKTLIKAFADGHFYSPIINTVEIEEAQARIWSDSLEILGVDFNDQNHHVLLSEVLPKYLEDYDYSWEPVDETTFYINNGQFGWCDSRILFGMLRYLEPKRIIEVGSGYTSLLTADVNRRFFKKELEFTCIEPYPREFLLNGVSGISRLIAKKIENLPLSTFSNLQSGDILFIDSSHVSKTGSDVNYLFFEVIPRLPEGVLIHIHDIFLPAEYPKTWILNEGRSWNEQYLVRALLMYTQGFEVVFGSAYSFYKHPELLKKVLQNHLQLGGSLWLRKK